MEDSEWVDVSSLSLVPDIAYINAWDEAKQNGNAAPTESDSWTPQNLAELPNKPPVEPTLGGLGFIYPGKRHVFSGPQESAKTLAAYVIGLEVVRSGGKVVLIDFEMGPWDAKARLRELGASDEELASILYVAPEAPASPRAAERLAAPDVQLVLIDAAAGAYDLQELDDNKRSDVERFTRLYVNGFWKAGIATIVLDHVTKNVETRGNYAIGSERKVGGADVHLGFSVISPIKRGSHGRYQVTTHKDRGGHLKRGKLATFELASDAETHHFTWSFVPAQETDDEHPFRPTALMEKISRFLEMQFEPVSKNRIEQSVKGKTDYKRLAIELLEEDGCIEISGAGVASLRVYREVDDDLAPTSPHLAPKTEDSTSPLRPPPTGGEGGGDLQARGEPSSPQDGIPF